MGGNIEGHAHILVLVGAIVYASGRRYLARRSVLPGKIGDVRPHVYLRLFIVQGHNLRRGKNGYIRILLVGLKHRPDVGKRHTADLNTRTDDSHRKAARYDRHTVAIELWNDRLPAKTDHTDTGGIRTEVRRQIGAAKQTAPFDTHLKVLGNVHLHDQGFDENHRPGNIETLNH